MGDTGGSAFPTTGAMIWVDPITPIGFAGLSKREYFAGQAMAGMLAGLYARNEDGIYEAMVAHSSCDYADALLAELEKKPAP